MWYNKEKWGENIKAEERTKPTQTTIAENIKIALIKFVVILSIAFIGFLITRHFDIVLL